MGQPIKGFLFPAGWYLQKNAVGRADLHPGSQHLGCFEKTLRVQAKNGNKPGWSHALHL